MLMLRGKVDVPALFTRRSYCHVWESIILPRVLLLSREESPKPKYVSAILRHNIKVEFLGAKNAGEQSTSFVKERTLQREIFLFFFFRRVEVWFLVEICTNKRSLQT